MVDFLFRLFSYSTGSIVGIEILVVAFGQWFLRV